MGSKFLSNGHLTHRFGQLNLSWETARDYFYILLGSLIQGVAMRLFLIPALLVSGGVSGLAQIINYFTGWPIGLMVVIGNVPLFILGWRYLGRLRFAIRTAFSLVVFSLVTDLWIWFLPYQGITNDLVLNSLYGGILYGIGAGLVYRGRGTSGGSDILGLILYRRLGISLTQAYLTVDALVVLAGGLAWNWELALYGIVVIYVCGLAAEMVSEGRSILRSAIIITAFPQEISSRILTELERGVTIVPGTGAYTGAARPVLYCVVSRAEVNKLKALVHELDPKAFMVIGQVSEALGEGFKPLKSHDH